MRALVVASNVEARYADQLASAARMQRLESEKKPSEAEKGHDPRNASLRMLYEHWLLHRHSLSRIGTYGRISELFPCAYVLRESLGRCQATGEDPDKVTNHRIAIEIPYSFIVDTSERDEPIELQGERDITIAESIRAGNEDS